MNGGMNDYGPCASNKKQAISVMHFAVRYKAYTAEFMKFQFSRHMTLISRPT